MKNISLFMKSIITLAMICIMSVQSNAQWTKIVANAPHSNYGVMLLMSDGRVLCHTTAGTVGDIYDILTPDIHGSYINGTWSSSAESHVWRYAFASQVLMD